MPHNGKSTSTTTITTLTSTLTTEEETQQQAGFEFYRQTHEHRIYTEVPAMLIARGAVCIEGFELEVPIDIVLMSNDQWTVFTCSPMPESDETGLTPGVVDYSTRYTQVTKTDLSQTWIIEHKQHSYLGMDRPQALMAPRRWTQDGEYVYLKSAFYPAPNGFPTSAYFRTDSNLHRLNLLTGEFETILAPNTIYSYALSPNDRYLVYSRKDAPSKVKIVDLISGREESIELDNDPFVSGSFVWNPGSTKVIFGTGEAKASNDWSDDVSKTSIFVLSISNSHIQPILVNEPRLLVPWNYFCEDTQWSDSNTVCLRSLDRQIPSYLVYTINTQTGHVIALPTPNYGPNSTATTDPNN